MVIVGDQEEAKQTLSLRRLDGTKENDVPLQEFKARLRKEAKIPSPKKSRPSRR
jgi:threonyl-tRNA synthetase